MLRTSLPIPDQLAFWNFWHHVRGASGRDEVHQRLREIFLRELGSGRERRRALDLGCGGGHDIARFAQAGHEVWGLDFSKEALKSAQRILKRSRLPKQAGVTLVERDLAQRLPFEDEFFDGIYSHLALHYFHDDVTRRIFHEIQRVARPGALFVFSVKSTDDPYFGKGEQLGEFVYCRKGHVRHFFTEVYVEELLAEWHDVKIEARRGRYASSIEGVFIHVVARKPMK